MKKILLFIVIILLLIQSLNTIGDKHIEVNENLEEVVLEELNVEDIKPIDITYTETIMNTDAYNYLQQNYVFKDYGYYFSRKINFKQNDGVYLDSLMLPGHDGLIRYFDQGELVEIPFYQGALPQTSKLFLETDKYSYLLGAPYTYKDIGDGTVQSFVNENAIKLSKVNEQWFISWEYESIEDSYGIMWGLGSYKQLVDFTIEENVGLWNYYDMDKKARLLQDGYYYQSPLSYTPSTTSSFWRNPSMYIASAFIREGGSIASDMLGQALLLTGIKNINEEGFLATLPRSEWLYEDYGIGKQFFDTRFNADMIETYIMAYRKFGQEDFRDAYMVLSDYYMKHILNQHMLVSNEETRGWLVEDYNHGGVEVETHCSLNHQLEAIHVLLLLYEDEEKDQYLEYATLMLNGIKVTKDKWIMSDMNLEYAYLPNGDMGFSDYPYLTYNDLYKVQHDLERILGERDQDLEKLMKAKKEWMDKQGISNYKK